ncbi:transposase [Streptomyces sp. NPDC059949]|uniref:transposase n=1 Tax=Streptomyces sp. NPDC059949 TaxID=3347013 RepID=UPI003658763E
MTAALLRDVIERLIAAGQRTPGEPDIVTDAGYDVTRLAWVLQDLPVDLVSRARGDRATRLPQTASRLRREGRPTAEARDGVPLRCRHVASGPGPERPCAARTVAPRTRRPFVRIGGSAFTRAPHASVRRAPAGRTRRHVPGGGTDKAAPPASREASRIRPRTAVVACA